MPIYEYECDRCSSKTERLVLNFRDEMELTCQCGGSLKRLISHSSFVLKGSGWYVTDYANKDKKSGAYGEAKIHKPSPVKSEETKKVSSK